MTKKVIREEGERESSGFFNLYKDLPRHPRVTVREFQHLYVEL